MEYVDEMAKGKSEELKIGEKRKTKFGYVIEIKEIMSRRAIGETVNLKGELTRINAPISEILKWEKVS